MSSSAVIGWGMAAALQLGAALGLSPLIIGELFPQVETLMVRRINEQAGSGSLERLDA